MQLIGNMRTALRSTRQRCRQFGVLGGAKMPDKIQLVGNMCTATRDRDQQLGVRRGRRQHAAGGPFYENRQQQRQARAVERQVARKVVT